MAQAQLRVLPGTLVGALFPRNLQGRPPALRQVMRPIRLAEVAGGVLEQILPNQLLQAMAIKRVFARVSRKSVLFTQP